MIVTARLQHSDISALMRHMTHGSNRAMVRALRDASQAMQTSAVRGVAERVNLTQREIRQDLTKVQPVYAGSMMTAGIRLRKDFWNPSASKFNVVQKPAGVAATIWKGSRTTYQHTFLLQGAAGGSGVFFARGRRPEEAEPNFRRERLGRGHASNRSRRRAGGRHE